VPPNLWVVLSVLGLPFVAAALVPPVYRAVGDRVAYLAAAVAAGCFGLLASQAGTEGLVSVPWIDAAGLQISFAFYLDGLALLIGFLASGIGVLIFTYSRGYMDHEPGKVKYYATLLAFMGSMLGVALAADLLTLFLFWEFTSVSSFILIGHYQDREASTYGARKSMLITVAGGLFMLLGFLLLYAVSGNVFPEGPSFMLFGERGLITNADAVTGQLREQGLFVPVLGLIGIGAAAKSAQVPLHIWLPNAMEAPTPVSAFLHSATMVKAGVYLVGRLRPLLGGADWELLFVVLGLLTMTVTAILAVAASDIKELLAYSTASHLGLIIAGFGVIGLSKETGFIGAEAGAFHILNHALFKAALFLVAGVVAHEAGTRAIDELGGLWRDLPVAAGVAVVSSLGMAGVPPFNGFYSKEFLFDATWELAAHADSARWFALPAVAVFGSVFTFLYSIRFLMLFFGEKPDALEHVHAPHWSMRVPPLTLGLLAGVVGLGGVTALFGVHFGPVEQFVEDVISSTLAPGGELKEFSYHVPDHLTPPVAMSGVTLAAGAGAFPFFDRIRDGVREVRSVSLLRPNTYYDAAVFGLDRSRLVSTYVHNGLLRTYAAALLLAVSLATLAGYVATGIVLPAPEFVRVVLPGGIGMILPSLAVPAAMAVVLLVALVAGLAVLRAPSHIAGVLVLSILGFMIAIFYILADAPDLALTQLLIETLVLVLFLLVLDKLPAFYGDPDRGRVVRDLGVSAVVGVAVFLTVLSSSAANPTDVIAQFFLDRGGVPAEHGPIFVDYGGGANIVNVILVDFRAFDTLGEISVIGLAALAVITMIAMRERGETQ